MMIEGSRQTRARRLLTAGGLIAAAIGGSAPGYAAAQDTTSAFGQILPGARLRVRQGGYWTMGEFLSAERDTLRIALGEERRPTLLPLGAVTRIEVSRGPDSGSRLAAAARWLSSGAVLGGIIGLIAGGARTESTKHGAAPYGTAALVTGAVLGATFGLANPGERWELLWAPALPAPPAVTPSDMPGATP